MQSFLNSRPTWSIQGVPGKPELNRERQYKIIIIIIIKENKDLGEKLRLHSDLSSFNQLL